MNMDFWRIKSIHVAGLLHSHNLCWELYPKVNILGGSNGSGKSTLLRALALLLQSACITTSGKGELRYQSDILIDSLLTEFYSGLSIKAELGNSDRHTNRLSDNFSINGKPLLAQEVERSQLARHIIYINSFEHTINAISRLVEKTDTNNGGGKTILDLMLEHALNTRNQLFAQRMSKAMQAGEDDRIKILRRLFGHFEIAVKRFMPEYVILDTSTLLFASANNPEVKINYLHLSTGEKQLLYLLLTVCNTLEESTILLLDEADMGMHIDWKKILLRELLKINPNMQIIAATHSPALIDGWYANVREISQLYTSVIE